LQSWHRARTLFHSGVCVSRLRSRFSPFFLPGSPTSSYSVSSSALGAFVHQGHGELCVASTQRMADAETTQAGAVAAVA